MVRCPRCGYENEVTDIYCRNCTYPLQDPKTNFSTKRKRNKSWNIGTGKKIVLVIGIVVISFLLFSIIHNITQPSPQSSLNVVTSPDAIHQSSSNPFKVNITTNGTWYGEISEGQKVKTFTGSGNKILSLSSASWDDVSIKITKTNSNSDPLDVQLLKNGKVIAENTTTDPQSTITLNN